MSKSSDVKIGKLCELKTLTLRWIPATIAP